MVIGVDETTIVFALVLMGKFGGFTRVENTKGKREGNGRIMYWGTGRRDAMSLALKIHLRSR